MEIFKDVMKVRIKGFTLIRENYQHTKMLSYHVPFYIRKSRRNPRTKKLEIYYAKDEVSKHQRLITPADHIGECLAEFATFLETEVPKEFRKQTNKYNVERFKKLEDELQRREEQQI